MDTCFLIKDPPPARNVEQVTRCVSCKYNRNFKQSHYFIQISVFFFFSIKCRMQCYFAGVSLACMQLPTKLSIHHKNMDHLAFFNLSFLGKEVDIPAKALSHCHNYLIHHLHKRTKKKKRSLPWSGNHHDVAPNHNPNHCISSMWEKLLHFIQNSILPSINIHGFWSIVIYISQYFGLIVLLCNVKFKFA